jgi:hypothetical protein
VNTQVETPEKEEEKEQNPKVEDVCKVRSL